MYVAAAAAAVSAGDATNGRAYPYSLSMTPRRFDCCRY